MRMTKARTYMRPTACSSPTMLGIESTVLSEAQSRTDTGR